MRLRGQRSHLSATWAARLGRRPRRERTGHALHLPAPASPYAILLLRPHTRLVTACSRVEAAHTHHEAARESAGPDRATGVFLNILTSRPRGPLVDVSYIKPVKRTVRLSPHVKYVGLGTREVLSGPIRSLSTSFIRPARAHAAPARHAHWHRTAHPAVHQHQRNPGKTCVRRPGFTFSHLSESVSLTATGVLVVPRLPQSRLESDSPRDVRAASFPTPSAE